MIRSELFKGEFLLMNVDCIDLIIPKLGEGHLVHGEGSCLVRTDVVSSAHRLASIHSAHKVIVK